MCGICGFVGDGSVDDLRGMTTAMTHRGPDDEGYWHDPEARVYLGHRRLAIIDLAGGKQPMWSVDRDLVVVFNGEIYNHADLRKVLIGKGHRFRSDHSDTEVLLAGYREWKEELPNHLNGMWAFAIYDPAEGRIFISRDRFGKKPIFHTTQNGAFVFSSELGSLRTHKGITPSLSEIGLQKYFAYGYVPAPNTIYRHIHKLPGGYNLLLDTKTLAYQTTKYWDFVLEPEQRSGHRSEDAAVEELLEKLSRAVRRRLIADVPIGVFLSGGIDSASIAAIAAQTVGSESVKTFSIGFEEPSFDESRYSLRASQFIGTDHRLDMFSVDDARSLLPEITSRLDEPMGDGSLLPTFLLSRETRRCVTVALGGDGADELFAGYDPFRALQYARCYHRLIPRPVHQAITMLVGRLPVSHRNLSLDFKLKRTLRGLSHSQKLWNSIWLGPLGPTELSYLFKMPIKVDELYSEAIEVWDRCPQTNLIDKTLQFYTKLYLQDDILVKIDRAGMMNSLEVRAPFLDIEFVDFVRTLPATYKFRRGQTKYILKKALRSLLPSDIIHRSKKGFGIPIGKWFRDKEIELKTSSLADAMNVDYVEQCIVEHHRGVFDHRAFLWNYWLLEKFVNRQ